MKRNFNQVFTAIDGAEINGAPTLKGIAVEALLAVFPDEQNLRGEQKVKRYDLALRIHNADDEVILTAEDISMLKDLIGRACTPLFVGQAYRMLEE